MTLRTIACLARTPGLLILDELLTHPSISLQRVYTHLYLPKAEGGGVRPEYKDYDAKAKELLRTDYSAGSIGQGLGEPWDLLIVCNWRNILSELELSRFATKVNIHRGDLPKYPGARPILQALAAGDEIFAITAHHMVPELDAGPVIRKEWYQSRYRHGETIEESEARIRSEMEPLYAPLVRRVINRIVHERNHMEG